MSSRYTIRRNKSRGSVGYQLGHYEMEGRYEYRRSYFKVDVHLGEHPSAAAALEAWPGEIQRMRAIGREGKAAKLEGKLDRLRALTADAG